jgi:hypothetical protein
MLILTYILLNTISSFIVTRQGICFAFVTDFNIPPEKVFRRLLSDTQPLAVRFKPFRTTHTSFPKDISFHASSSFHTNTAPATPAMTPTYPIFLTTAPPVLCTTTVDDDDVLERMLVLGLRLVLVVPAKLTLSPEAPETLLTIGIGMRGVATEADEGNRVSCDEVAPLSTVNG